MRPMSKTAFILKLLCMVGILAFSGAALGGAAVFFKSLAFLTVIPALIAVFIIVIPPIDNWIEKTFPKV